MDLNISPFSIEITRAEIENLPPVTDEQIIKLALPDPLAFGAYVEALLAPKP